LALAEGDRATSLGVSILNVPPILDSTDPLTITGKAYAEVSSLRYLTVTVSPSGDLIDVKSWANGVVSETNWSATWVLAGLDDGAHSLQAELLAWDGTQAEESLTVTLDTQPPEVSIASLVLTSTNFIAPDRLEVSGLVSDTGGVVGVQVWVAEGVYDAEIEGNDWRAVWSLGEGPLPDNQAYLISAQATDVAGHTTLVSETVTVDLVSPAAVTLSMSSTGIPLEPGDTLRSPSGLLTLDWGLSSDGSGVADYLVEWVGTTTSTEKVIYDSPYPLSASQYLADEGQKVSVRLGIADIYGQTTWESFGPVYVDGHQTPDYVPLDDSDGIYHGWMESGCTLVGVDRRITEGAQANAALGVEQRLYTTWNAEALRLAWTGANWNSDGDLFVYLDTRPGGASTLFDPYLATISNTLIYLPDGFEADIVVWVRDSSTALFLDWAGSGWVFQGALSDEQYAFDPALNDGQTDLYLPFSILGLVAGDSLDLLALASEEGGLRLWAALPNANPLNSELVVNTDFNSAESYEFGLMQVYHWDSLGVGVCPNGSDGTGTAYLDSDLKMSLSLVPTGIAYNLVGDGLFWLQDLLIDSPPADVTSYLNFLNKEVLLLGNGQEIEYTIQYRNQGTQTAKGVFAAVEAQHALFLPTGNPDDMHKMVAIGDIEPGEVGEVTFRGVVDTSRSIEPWAGVLVRIFDATHGLAGEPLEWLWAHHKLDNRGPEFFGLQEPVYLIGADPVELSGYAYDESGVPEIRLKVQPPVGNLTRITCPDDQPTDGYWSCVWDVAASNGGTPPENGDVFRLRLRAKDDLGQLSAETNMLYFMVDTQPPTVTLDLSMTQFFSGQILRGGTFGLAGEVYDNGGVESVSLCSEGECEIANLILAPGQEAVVYTDNPDTPVPINGGTTCGGGEILRTFQVNESFMVAEVRLGFSAEHSRRDDLLVSLRSPLGTIVQVLYDDGISGTEFKNYNVLLSDFEPLGLADLVGDHDLDGLIYDRFGRPSQPLRVFQSRDSAGTWTLSICDQNPTANDGAYLHSQLILVPMDTTSKSGHWYQQTPDLGELDYMTKTISIYGQDVVGNRSTEPLRVELLVDNVPPSITVTLAAPESIPLGEITTILGGRVTDGSPLAKVYLHIWTPDGDIYRQSAAREGARWWFDLEPFQAGEYTVLLSASDLAGNKTTRGPFKITVTEIPKYYFPLVMVRYMPEPRVYEWDFSGVVGSEWSSATISATPSGERFLGQFGRETVFLELPDLQPHTRVTLDFDLYLIRSWDGNLISATLPIMVGLPAYSPLDETIIIGPDIWEVGYGGSQSLLLTTFNNWKGSVQAYPDNYPDGENPSMTDAVAVDSLGYAFGTIPMDSIYHLQFTFDHNEADLILNFGALISEDIHDESWGLDNVRVVVEE
jgi:subtilisin-like proprotein convertase family protein